MKSAKATRRTTLGPVSMSSANSRSANGRLSMGPADFKKGPRMSIGGTGRLGMGRPSLGPGQTPMTPSSNRQMIAPSTQRRQSSAFSSGGPSIGPNPTDKTVVSNNLRTLVEFLSQRGYDHPLSAKTLSKPTSRDFQQIVAFLFRQLDPNFVFTGKLEEEVSSMFKFLGYPLPLAKSSISSAGTSHAWPHLLAALVWLVELLNYDNLATSAMISGQFVGRSTSDGNKNGIRSNGGIDDDMMDLEDPTTGSIHVPSSSKTTSEIAHDDNRMFYNYLAKAYGLFISGRDAQYASLEEKFVTGYERKHILLKDEVDALRSKNSALSAEIDTMKLRAARVPELETRHLRLRSERDRLVSVLSEVEHLKEMSRTRSQTSSNNLNSLRLAIAEASKEVAVLRDKVSQQGVSAEDVSQMIAEHERLTIAVQQASEFRQTTQTRAWELEMALRDAVQTLIDTVTAYHSIASDLQLVPATAANARGQSLVIELDVKAKRREQLLRTAVQRDVLPVLQEIASELRTVSLSIRGEMLSEKEAQEVLSQKQSELTEESKVLDGKIRRLEDVQRREKATHEQLCETLCAEMDKLEARLREESSFGVVSGGVDGRLAAYQRRKVELEALRVARREKFGRRKSELLSAIVEAISQCAAHRDLVSSQLSAAKDQFSSQAAELMRTPRFVASLSSNDASLNPPTSQTDLYKSTNRPDLINITEAMSPIRGTAENVPLDEEDASIFAFTLPLPIGRSLI